MGDGVRLIWERDGSLIDSVQGSLQLQLRVSPVQVVDSGHYTCRAELTDPTTPNLPAESAGSLTVLGKAGLLPGRGSCHDHCCR